MKLTRGTVTWLIIGFIWCIFMGVTAISIGVGSLFPKINEISAPIVCPGGQYEVEAHPYQVSPVENGYTLKFYCVDARSGAKTELGFWPKYLVAGSIYGTLLFIFILAIWLLYNRWNASVDPATSAKWNKRIIAAAVIVIVVGCTGFSLFPLIGPALAPKASVSAPEVTATALEPTFQALTLGQPRAFNVTATPSQDWKGFPIMPEATTGHQVDDHTYTFDVVVDTGGIEKYYTDTLKSMGWTLADSRWLGMKFTKNDSILLVTMAPAADEQSFLVTLILVP